MNFALKVGFLAFDATRLSSTDIDYPIDVILYKRDSFKMVTHRYNHNDLYTYSDKWRELIAKAMRDMPDDLVNTVFSKIKK